MRSSLLLARFLAVVSFVSASPTPTEIARNSSATFVLAVNLSPGPFFGFLGCVSLGVLTQEVTPQGGPGNQTVESCMFECNSRGFDQGGVGKNQRFCDNGASSLPALPDSDCQQLTCLGNSTQLCGSSNSVIFYEVD